MIHRATAVSEGAALLRSTALVLLAACGGAETTGGTTGGQGDPPDELVAVCPGDARFAAGDLDNPWRVDLLFRAGARITLAERTGSQPGSTPAASPTRFIAEPDTEHASPADAAALDQGIAAVTELVNGPTVMMVENHGIQATGFVDGRDMRLWFEVHMCPSQTREQTDALASELGAIAIVDTAETGGGPPPDMTPPGM